jgi:GT2 family glycosyltransferase
VLSRSPLVSIIILNWNGCQDTLACLASLAKLGYAPYTIVVVDNHSTDDSVVAIRREYPTITLLETSENLGFVGGNNLGIEHAQRLGSDYILLLNNDTEVAPDLIRQMVTVAEADPHIGVVGPTIYYYEQPDVIWSAGGHIDWSKGRTWMMNLDEADQGQLGTLPRPVSFVTGCALLARRAVFNQVGLLDKRFFMYYEETEWCTRATRAGYRIVHVPQAKVWHKISYAARDTSPIVSYYMTRNRLLLLRLVHAGWRAWVHTLFEYSRTLVSFSLRPRWRNKRGQRDLMLMAIRDYIAGRFGYVPLDQRTA